MYPRARGSTDFDYAAERHGSHVPTRARIHGTFREMRSVAALNPDEGQRKIFFGLVVQTPTHGPSELDAGRAIFPARLFRPLAAPLRAVEVGVDVVAHVLSLPVVDATTIRPQHPPYTRALASADNLIPVELRLETDA
jgi:hypothetical protein